MIWNIGALAASGHPKALDLFRQILRASSAIPGAFEPVLLDVEIDGRKYQEMHVDGGAIAQLFLYPPTIEVGQLGAARARVAYIIRNGRLDPEHTQTERRTINIASRAIATMLAASGQNDVIRTYFVSRRDGVDYNLAYIGADFSAERPGEFDPVYMQALFDYGYREARDGQAWHKVPPGLRAGRPGAPTIQRAISSTGVRSDCTRPSVRGPRNLVSPWRSAVPSTTRS